MVRLCELTVKKDQGPAAEDVLLTEVLVQK